MARFVEPRKKKRIFKREEKNKDLLEILAAKLFLQEFGKVLLANWILQQLLEAKRPPTDPFRLNLFPEFGKITE